MPSPSLSFFNEGRDVHNMVGNYEAQMPPNIALGFNADLSYKSNDLYYCWSAAACRKQMACCVYYLKTGWELVL